ncbi:peptidase M75, partial [Streptomyces sp. NPDC048659]
DKQFAALNTLLDKYRADKTSYVFTSYEKVGKEQRKELSDGVNALAEPLSKLAAAVVK